VERYSRAVFTKPKGMKKQRRAAKSRAERVSKTTAALLGSGGFGVGRGRPSGSFKYGMPIQQYKEIQRRQRQLYNVYASQNARALQQRGLSPQQINQLELTRSAEQVSSSPQSQQPYTQQSQEQIPSTRVTRQQVTATADDELAFRKWMATEMISPNTQQMLINIRRIQLKSKRDDVEQQRRNRERRMVAAQMDIMHTPYILNDVKLDFTHMQGEDNLEILKAPNIFAEDKIRNPNILSPRGFNILDTKSAGNNLF
jgi:hypothetical protein